ncbi:MAG: hypothetical protein P1U46_02670 [Patescibacteria group bacterium]|nr:hypothetical protein [Patescibacteria group bacterium]
MFVKLKIDFGNNSADSKAKQYLLTLIKPNQWCATNSVTQYGTLLSAFISKIQNFGGTINHSG